MNRRAFLARLGISAGTLAIAPSLNWLISKADADPAIKRRIISECRFGHDFTGLRKAHDETYVDNGEFFAPRDNMRLHLNPGDWMRLRKLLTPARLFCRTDAPAGHYLIFGDPTYADYSVARGWVRFTVPQ